MEELLSDSLTSVGKHLYEKYFGPGALDWPIGTDLQYLATQYLHDLGFDRVEWAQPKDSDDILLCLIWWGGGKKEAIIEFAGHDAAIISIFALETEVVL